MEIEPANQEPPASSSDPRSMTGSHEMLEKLVRPIPQPKNIFTTVAKKVACFSSSSGRLSNDKPPQLSIYSLVILINATSLKHKSTLSTNNFGINHFGQKYQKENILRIFRRFLWILFENSPTNRAKTRKCVFGQIFISSKNFVTLKTLKIELYFFNRHL